MTQGSVSVIAEVSFPLMIGAIGGVTIESLWEEQVRIEPRWRPVSRPARVVWRVC